MKVSADQKAQIRKRLLDAAVALITAKGFAATTMREISQRAGFSPSTIYNYFDNKEGIFYAYFDESQNALAEAMAEVGHFDQFDLKEKLQTLLETQLEVLAPDRAFVDITYRALLDSPLKNFSALEPPKSRFTQMVQEIFSHSPQTEGVNAKPFENFLIHLFWDYKNLMVMYWLKDTSDGYANTSRLIDMSLDIYIEVVKSGLVTRIADVVSFLIKGHLYGNIDRIYDLVGVLAGTGPGPSTGE